jgi:hypothetical protein
MLAHDRRVLDVPLEERLQSRTSELLAWAKTMLPVINRSVRDSYTIQTGHQDIRSYFSKATVVTTGDRQPTSTERSSRNSNTTSTEPRSSRQQHQYRGRSSRATPSGIEPRSFRHVSWIGGAFKAHEPTHVVWYLPVRYATFCRRAPVSYKANEQPSSHMGETGEPVYSDKVRYVTLR